MHERRGDELDHQNQYLVLGRACAELYEEVASLLADWPDVVVVDRRGVEEAPRGHIDPVFPQTLA